MWQAKEGRKEKESDFECVKWPIGDDENAIMVDHFDLVTLPCFGFQ